MFSFQKILFCSDTFLVFFGAVFAAYWALPWRQARVWLLVAASYFFYATWSRQLALVVFASTVMDYLIARGLAASASPGRRRLLLGVSLAVNLGLLAYFKYANFFLQSLEAALQAAGASASLPVLRVVAPLGISFYTFEAISYTVDVYRGRVPAERDLGHLLLFITFFPHLMAGPIVRARDFLPQVRRPKRWDWVRAQLGVGLFAVGLFKKAVIADRMALFSDPVFQDPTLYKSYAVWVAVLAYALQIYCDFSGYSDMALGAAHLLGYSLARNFDLPYLAVNVSDFWRRWHISLSSWLRDYLFIPLGGSRGGLWRTCRNLMLTMALGGLWHGASWTFVAWGVFHGLLLVAHRLWQGACEARPRLAELVGSAAGTVVRTATTFLCVALGWVLFRAGTFAAAEEMFRRLFVGHAGVGCPLHDSFFWYTVALVAGCHAAARGGLWRRAAQGLPAPVVGFSYGLLLSLVLLFTLSGTKAFLYFQF
jgi:alginate O-acetyltransferase complex protein AlgI